MTQPTVLVARAIFPETIQRLQRHFTVRSNQADVPWTPATLGAALADCDGVLTSSGDRIDATVLAAAPRLRICANMGVGYNNFDVAAMAARGVVGTNAPGVLSETTADFGFALLMAAARRLTESEHFLRRGDWKGWRYDQFAGQDIHGSTLGILGMGRIGQGIARRGAHGFAMRVIYHNRSRLDAATEAACGAQYVGKSTLLAQADHLVLVLPYTPEAHHAIGAAELAQMKPSATLTNIARGGIVDDAALAASLQAGRLHAAALDVFEGEPSVNPALLACRNIVLAPHIASSSVPTRRAMAELAADNLVAFFQRGAVLTAVTPLPAAVAHELPAAPA